MATKTIVQLVDDLDGKELAEGKGETVRFGLDGVEYELDLSNQHAKQLRKALEQYVASGRRVGGRRRQGGHTRRVATREDTRAVREWARAHGLEVSERGRIPYDVIDQYRAAGN